VNIRHFARLGVLAVGLGISAAVVNSPIALADTDFQISFDGMELFPTSGNEATATTVAGEFGLAIAYGDGATAVAEGGTGDFAVASGSDALAEAGSLTATSGNNFDAAIDVGNNAGIHDGAFAGGGSLVGGSDGGSNSGDTAIDIGNNTGISSGAFSGDYALLGGPEAGNGDTAYTYGNTAGTDDASWALGGNNNYASLSGTESASYSGSFAGNGDGNSAIDDTSSNVDDSYVQAFNGNDNYAYVYGPDNSTALAGGSGGGNDNIAYVSDPFGTAANPDSAFAGNGFSNDLASVLFTHGNALATGADYAYDVITPLGPEAGTAAATGSTSLLSELLALF
jgi:hypothetical protein